MAQVPCIGLYKPYTNLPFGVCVCVPCILTLRYIYTVSHSLQEWRLKP